MTEQNGNIDPSDIGPIGWRDIALMLVHVFLRLAVIGLIFGAGYLANMYEVL